MKGDLVYSSTTHLFSRSLAADLRERLDRIEASISRADLQALDKIASADGDLVAPSLVREDIEFDPSDSGTKVHVQVTVPVTGDEKLLELAPDHLPDRRKISIRLTNDLNWMRDTKPRGNAFQSRNWSGGNQATEPRRGGFLFSRSFEGTVSGDEVHEWATSVVDWVEEVLQATSKQVEEFNASRTHLVSVWVEERKKALETAESLKGDLGRGL